MKPIVEPTVIYIVPAFLALLAPATGSTQGVCGEGTIAMTTTTEMIRSGNNRARACAASTISGRRTSRRLPRVKLTEKRNGSIVKGPQSDERRMRKRRIMPTGASG